MSRRVISSSGESYTVDEVAEKLVRVAPKNGPRHR